MGEGGLVASYHTHLPLARCSSFTLFLRLLFVFGSTKNGYGCCLNTMTRVVSRCDARLERHNINVSISQISPCFAIGIEQVEQGCITPDIIDIAA